MSCSSAVIFWHFFFSCCTERCTSSLSACSSANCGTHTQKHTHVSVAATVTYVWTPLVCFYLPLQVPLGLLLCIQLVVKLLLQPLFDKVHLANGSVVLDPPFASWGEDKNVLAGQDDDVAILGHCGSKDSETRESPADGGNTKKKKTQSLCQSSNLG